MESQLNKLSWKEVAAVHGTNAGVSVVNGQVSSILVSEQPGGSYRNTLDGDSIRYHIKHKGNGKYLAGMMIQAIESHIPVRVFYKEGPDQWQDLGYFTVVSSRSESTEDFFSLAKLK